MTKSYIEIDSLSSKGKKENMKGELADRITEIQNNRSNSIY